MDEAKQEANPECLILNEIAIISEGSAAERTGLAVHTARSLEYNNGDEIYREGDDIAGVHCLHKGKVALVKRSSDGEGYITSTVEPGDILGVPEVLSTTEYTNTAIALEPSTACFIPREEFLVLIREYPAIVFRLMQRICERIQEVEERGDNG